MNENNALDEDKMAEIETRAITDTATRWRIGEELVDNIVQDYTEMIEDFERYLNEGYPNEDMDTQPYVAMEINTKVARDIAIKYNMDEEVVINIIHDYAEIIRDSLEREMHEELDEEY
jgi:hypothetical protein